jgi:hypothetical protein
MVTRSFAVRLDARKYQTVARLARQRGATLSDAVREALDGWIERARTDGVRVPYVAVADLVGAVDSHPKRPLRVRTAKPTAKRTTSRGKARR